MGRETQAWSPPLCVPVHPALEEWPGLLSGDWSGIRAKLLDEGEEGQRLRQSNPFTGVLSPAERWEILRRFRDESSAA